MGQEVATSRFNYYDFHRFDKLIKHEMDVLRHWFRDGHFSGQRSIAGLELEAWLIDAACQPVPWNEQVIALTGSPDIVPELARFNIEFNVAPQPLAGSGLAELSRGLSEIWRRCETAADRLGTSILSIGVLPTVTDSMLTLANMTKSHRYQALNEQVLRLRQGKPIRLDLRGREELVTEHRDVTFESAATSLQLHLQVPLQEAVRYYNAAIVASAVMVAIASNSPFLFGKSLWEETRIPIFEQAVDVGGDLLPRVTFGSGYAVESLEEVFSENEANYPTLLPLAMESASDHLDHVRLHNGTIWRWNRPLIGFDKDHRPHLRIENRVMAAGPTLADMTANMSLFYGLVESLARDRQPPETCLSFPMARENFYHAAQHGLDCEIQWLNGDKHQLAELFLAELLPRAAAGLRQLQVDPTLADSWLNTIEARVRSGQTGSVWQRRFVEQHGKDFVALTQAYQELQRAGEPVHTWTLERRTPTLSFRPVRSMLQIVDELPRGLLEAGPTELLELLGQPTLIHLPGRRHEPIFVSIVLHGNEDVGLRAVQALLQKHGDRQLPRGLSILIGNIAAAQKNVRYLPNQPDYNRVWPGSDRYDTPEHAMMRHIVAEMRERKVFASIDLHNNTGWNPHYACVTRLDNAHLQLAALFSRQAVYFQRPLGVQTMAFSDIAPSVTCECGKVGDETGVHHAAEFLDACLHLEEIPPHLPAEGDLHLFHTVATVKVPESVRFMFEEAGHSDLPPPFTLALRSDLERLNFQELVPGSLLGRTRLASVPLVVTDESGRIVTNEFLAVKNGQVLLRKTVIPAMLTCNQDVIQQDCVGYFMERYQISGSQ